MKQTPTKTVIIALIGILSVGLFMPWGVQANPIVHPTNELPTLTVQTPDSTSPYYAANALELNFTVTKPQSWNEYQYGTIPEVGFAQTFLYLDGELTQAYPWTSNTTDQYSVVFTNLTQQQHTVWIDVWCHIEYDGSNASVSQTLTFTMDSQAQTIAFHQDPITTTKPGTRPIIVPPNSPMPTLPPISTPTPTHTSTSSETSTTNASNNVFHISFLSELLIALTIILAFCSVFVSVLRRRGRP
jgi:hypothetical protein